MRRQEQEAEPNKDRPRLRHELVLEYKRVIESLSRRDYLIYALVRDAFDRPDEFVEVFDDMNRDWYPQQRDSGLPRNCQIYDNLRIYHDLGGRFDFRFFENFARARPYRAAEAEQVMEELGIARAA